MKNLHEILFNSVQQVIAQYRPKLQQSFVTEWLWKTLQYNVRFWSARVLFHRLACWNACQDRAVKKTSINNEKKMRCATTQVTRLKQEKNMYHRAYSHGQKWSLMRVIPCPLVPADRAKNWPSLFRRCSIWMLSYTTVTLTSKPRVNLRRGNFVIYHVNSSLLVTRKCKERFSRPGWLGIESQGIHRPTIHRPLVEGIKRQQFIRKLSRDDMKSKPCILRKVLQQSLCVPLSHQQNHPEPWHTENTTQQKLERCTGG